MSCSPALKRAEEKASFKKEEGSPADDSPALKRMCTMVDKKLSKLPAGDLSLVKDTPPVILVTPFSKNIFVMGVPSTPRALNLTSVQTQNAFIATRFQELLTFGFRFRDEASTDPRAHPAHLVLDMLAGPGAENNKLHGQQLDHWFSDYAKLRGQPQVYRPAADLLAHINQRSIIFFQVHP